MTNIFVQKSKFGKDLIVIGTELNSVTLNADEAVEVANKLTELLKKEKLCLDRQCDWDPSF